MKQRGWPLLVVAGLTALLLASSVFAQDGTRPRIGVGVAISDVNDLIASTATTSNRFPSIAPTIFVPINITSWFRVEPEVGFYGKSSTDTGFVVITETVSSLHVGAGAFGLASRERFTLYYGGRAGYLRETDSVSQGPPLGTGTKNSVPGYFVAPAIGGECFLSDYLALGGEVQVKFSSWNWNHAAPLGSTRVRLTATHGALTLRFYFPHSK